MTSAAILAAFVLSVDAQASSVDDLDIKVVLMKDGSARITEVWDVDIYEGTEWYLVRSNLGDIVISDLSVEENGSPFIYEGAWDVDRSISAKAGRCGIVSKSNGCEICWGLGSHGSHVFTVSYLMSNVVKSLDDYDMVHMQFVSPGLSSAPEHVKVTISSPCMAFDSENSRIWGFGYIGSTAFEDDGTLVFESTQQFEYKSSVISLVRIDKGVFNSASVQSRSFDDVLEKALDGSSWKDDEEDDSAEGALLGFATVMAFLAGFIAILKKATSKLRMATIGVKSEKEIGWSRDIPYGGDLEISEYILEKLGKPDVNNNIAGAIILRLINNGNLTVRKDQSGKIEICFAQAPTDIDKAEGKLYTMMKEASGEDEILQDKEFSRWARRHKSTVHDWVTDVRKEGRQNLMDKGYLIAGQYTEESKANARALIGLRKFLKEFTLIKERGVSETVLWQDYLVFGALFGIADKVAKELKDIDPKIFQETMPYDYDMTRGMLNQTMILSRAITNTNQSYVSAQSGRSGFGGGSSFGGGGGFSGGGFGGGAR